MENQGWVGRGNESQRGAGEQGVMAAGIAQPQSPVDLGRGLERWQG